MHHDAERQALECRRRGRVPRRQRRLTAQVVQRRSRRDVPHPRRPAPLLPRRPRRPSSTRCASPARSATRSRASAGDPPAPKAPPKELELPETMIGRPSRAVVRAELAALALALAAGVLLADDADVGLAAVRDAPRARGRRRPARGRDHRLPRQGVGQLPGDRRGRRPHGRHPGRADRDRDDPGRLDAQPLRPLGPADQPRHLRAGSRCSPASRSTRASTSSRLAPADASFYLLVFALFVFALALDFLTIAGYTSYVEQSSLVARIRRSLPADPAVRARVGPPDDRDHVRLRPGRAPGRRDVRDRPPDLPVPARRAAPVPGPRATSSSCGPSSLPASRSRCSARSCARSTSATG